MAARADIGHKQPFVFSQEQTFNARASAAARSTIR
jgi:hypothetical protein